jgi:hypothetical protein
VGGVQVPGLEEPALDPGMDCGVRPVEEAVPVSSRFYLPGSVPVDSKRFSAPAATTRPDRLPENAKPQHGPKAGELPGFPLTSRTSRGLTPPG